MTLRLLILFVALFAFACNDSAESHNSREAAANAPKSKADSLYKEVDDLHIEGMSKYGKLKLALGQVQNKLDSLVKLPKNKIDEDYQQALIDLQEDLNYAECSMDTWMQEFKDTIKDDLERRVQYLEAEKEKVTKVRDKILEGLKRADSLLAK
jgi:hypothetical protein